MVVACHRIIEAFKDRNTFLIHGIIDPNEVVPTSYPLHTMGINENQ